MRGSRPRMTTQARSFSNADNSSHCSPAPPPGRLRRARSSRAKSIAWDCSPRSGRAVRSMSAARRFSPRWPRAASSTDRTSSSCCERPMGAPSGSTVSRPSSRPRTSMSSSRSAIPRRSRPKRRPKMCRSSSSAPAIRSRPAWLTGWRGPAATSPASPSSRPSSAPSGSKSCATRCRGSPASPCCGTQPISA